MGKTFMPLQVALIGAVGTTLANLNDYCIVSTIFISKKVQKIQTTKFYNFLIRNFDKYPFLIVTIGTFVPIPIDFVRLLAISHHYPVAKYSLANFVGRFPRYFLLAMFGYAFQISNKAILLIFAIFLLLSYLLKRRIGGQQAV
jgi:ribonucleoside-triphosphate reductase